MYHVGEWGEFASALDHDKLAYRGSLAAAYMRSAQRPDGWFNYEYDFVEGLYRSVDNDVRQAGASFALAEYLKSTGDAETRLATERALQTLGGASIPLGEGTIVSRTGELKSARSGVTALSLLTELNYFESTGDGRFEPIRRGWLQGLVELQRPSGGFRKTPESDDESPYFNGEVWLAIAHYEQLFPNRISGSVLENAERYLMARYSQAPDIGFLHWGIMAASLRYRDTKQVGFLEFLSGLVRIGIGSMGPNFNPESNSAYLVEGLASAAAALRLAGRDSGILYKSIVGRSNSELTKCFELQIMPGQTQLVLREDCYLTDPTIGSKAGAVLNRRFRPRARIDFTQHFLSAVLKYQAIETAEGTSRAAS